MQSWMNFVEYGAGWLIDVLTLSAIAPDEALEVIVSQERFKQGDEEERVLLLTVALMMTRFDCGVEAYLNLAGAYERGVPIDTLSKVSVRIAEIWDEAVERSL